MTQNIYDDPAFFSEYGKLPRSLHGLDGAPEWPAIRNMLPDMACLRVLDLGCGFGWFSRWARENGAASVLGVDVSERMLTRAAAETPDPAILYQRADLETAAFDAGTFDLAYSSLALHYIADLAGLAGRIHDALTPASKLVFSVEHPVLTAPSRPEWSTTTDGRRVWPLERYLDEGPRVTNWLADGVIKQHRTIASYIAAFIGAGFRLNGMDEWSASPEQIAVEPAWAGERDRPFFLLMSFDRA